MLKPINTLTEVIDLVGGRGSLTVTPGGIGFKFYIETKDVEGRFDLSIPEARELYEILKGQFS